MAANTNSDTVIGLCELSVVKDVACLLADGSSTVESIQSATGVLEKAWSESLEHLLKKLSRLRSGLISGIAWKECTRKSNATTGMLLIRG